MQNSTFIRKIFHKRYGLFYFYRGSVKVLQNAADPGRVKFTGRTISSISEPLFIRLVTVRQGNSSSPTTHMFSGYVQPEIKQNEQKKKKKRHCTSTHHSNVSNYKIQMYMLPK